MYRKYYVENIPIIFYIHAYKFKMFNGGCGRKIMIAVRAPVIL